MKKTWLAFTLSVLLPGAGLAYLGYWLWGLVNLLLVVAVAVAGPLVLPAAVVEAFHYVLAGLAAASGGWAHAWCVQYNRDMKLGQRSS